MAGGYAAGNAAAKGDYVRRTRYEVNKILTFPCFNSTDFIRNCQRTYRESVVTSIIAASLATSWLKAGGLLTLTGAAMALEPNPGVYSTWTCIGREINYVKIVLLTFRTYGI